jgi:hypothetical protein
MTPVSIDHGDLQALRQLAALQISNVIVVIDHATAFTPPPREVAIPPMPRECFVISADALTYDEPELRPDPRRHRKHWQKHDKLPFYAGIRSRRHRR